MTSYHALLGLAEDATPEEIEEKAKSELRLWQRRTNSADLDRRQEAEKRVEMLTQVRAALQSGELHSATQPPATQPPAARPPLPPRPDPPQPTAANPRRRLDPRRTWPPVGPRDEEDELRRRAQAGLDDLRGSRVPARNTSDTPASTEPARVFEPRRGPEVAVLYALVAIASTLLAFIGVIAAEVAELGVGGAAAIGGILLLGALAILGLVLLWHSQHNIRLSPESFTLIGRRWREPLPWDQIDAVGTIAVGAQPVHVLAIRPNERWRGRPRFWALRTWASDSRWLILAAAPLGKWCEPGGEVLTDAVRRYAGDKWIGTVQPGM